MAKSNTIKLILRTLGVLLGILSISVAIDLYFNPYQDDALEKMNIITFIIMGIIFILYGITGKSSPFKKHNEFK